MRIYFSSERGLDCSRMTTENDFKKIIGDIDICIQFKMLEVEVPVMIQKPLLP
jgi:hypothetical protein